MSISPYAVNLNKYKTSGYGQKTYFQPRTGTYQQRIPAVPRRKVKAKRRIGYIATSGRKSELKNFDTAVASNIPATGAINTSLNLVREGTGDNQRVGRTIVIKSVQLNGSIVKASTATASTVEYDIAIVLDKQCNGANPTYANIFSGTTPHQLLNLDNSDRFQVLRRFQGVLGSQSLNTAGTAFSDVRDIISFYKQCNIPIKFDADNGDVTDLASNNLVLAWSTSSNNLIAADFNFRIRYSDM